MTTQRHIDHLRKNLYRLGAFTATIFFALFAAAPMMASAASATKPAAVSAHSIHNTFSASIANKGRLNANVVRPALAWTVSLTASSTVVWQTQSSQLTATANQNVGPTPYYIEIYDATAGNYVANCATGTTCTALVTQSNATTHYYQAFVAFYPPATGAPSGTQAYSSAVSVQWHGTTVTLSANQSTLPVSAATTLTATTANDVGPSPFWIEIYDATTGARLNYCGFGTTCAVSTTQTVATTHQFVAYVSSLSSTFPPAGNIATSNPVYATWNNGAYRVTLSGPTITFGTEILTATSNVNVGPTPYWIEIYNLDTGTRLAACGSGTTCAITVTPSTAGSHYAAFISSYSTTLPPAGTQATSNELTARRFILF